MEFFSRKPKELKQFERAMDNGDFRLAAELSKSEHVPEEAKAEAREKFSLYETLFQNKPCSKVQEYLDGIVATLKEKNIMNELALTGVSQNVIQFVSLRIALKDGMSEKALSIANSIKDKGFCTLALQTVASHLAFSTKPVEKPIEIITSFPISEHITGELKNLFVSRLILQDYQAAEKALIRNPDLKMLQSLKPIFKFVKENHQSVEKAYQAASSIEYPDDRNLALAIVAAVNSNYELMISLINSIHPELPKFNANIQLSFVSGLTYCGKFDEAAKLLESIKGKDSDLYHSSLGLLGIIWTSNASRLDNILNQMVYANCSRYVIIFWSCMILELLMAQQTEKAIKLINKLKDDNLRELLSYGIVNLLYEIKSATNQVI